MQHVRCSVETARILRLGLLFASLARPQEELRAAAAGETAGANDDGVAEKVEKACGMVVRSCRGRGHREPSAFFRTPLKTHPLHTNM